MLRGLAFRRLNRLQRGRVKVLEGSRAFHFGTAAHGQPDVTIRVHDPRCYGRLVFGGTLGAAEGYIDGQWSTKDLVSVIRLFAKNADVLRDVNGGFARFAKPGNKLINGFTRNTRRGSRRNIAAHYDLGNKFFELFLDSSMTYSAGMFEAADSTMHDASMTKYETIGTQLQIGPHDHVIEIGTGWGGFALYAAQRYGCRVTTTTISRRQYEYAKRRVQRAGLQRQVDVICQDYRDLRGAYDKLVSIEMIEAVGHKFLTTYFSKCSELLKPKGRALAQAITIPDQRFARYRKSTDFIQRYIFPGGCLPSVSAMSRAAGVGTDMQLMQMRDFGLHYERTLGHWRRRFLENLDEIRQLGLSESFLRMWHYYLCYCEGGFAERQISVAQLLFAKPEYRRSLTRAATEFSNLP